MLRDFALELVSAPGSGATITLPGSAPTGRQTWASRFLTSQVVLYVLDDSIQQEWGLGTLTVGSPSTIARPTVVLGNSAGTTARLNFAGVTRCYSGMPSVVQLAALGANAGRNLLINGRFQVQQRGTGAWTTTGSYTADRWALAVVGDTHSVSLVTLADSDRTGIGDESAIYALQSAVTGAATASNLSQLYQRIENLRLVSGRTVTLSFWAKGATALSLGAVLQANFGTGGSPSSAVLTSPTTFALSTSWARYQATFTVPSAAGKTFGSNGDSHLGLYLTLSSGTTNAASLGVSAQSGTFQFWGLQLEVANVATPLELRPYGPELALCQRYYQLGSFNVTGYQAAGSGTSTPISLPSAMRAAPTVAAATTVVTNATGVSVGINANGMGAVSTASTTASAAYVLVGTFTAAAEL
jgi:carbohydrate binding protein with CBM4/9 domain